MGKFAEIARKRKIADLSWGLAGRLTDLALLTLLFGAALTFQSKESGKMLRRLFYQTHEFLGEEKVRSLLYRLKYRGLIDYTVNIFQEQKITATGKKRLRQMIPEYDPVRSWDKHLYLVSYDIANEQNYARDNLRRILKALGCGLLQESVWLTPYNPRKVLEDFVAKNDLAGLVLVSDLGRDGSVGEEDNRGLVARVYRLDELNQRYEEFLERWQKKKHKPEMLSHFFSILKDDPQLPFALLPDDWLGEKAWELISPKFKI